MRRPQYHIVVYEDGFIWIDGIKRRKPHKQLLELMQVHKSGIVIHENGTFRMAGDPAPIAEFPAANESENQATSILPPIKPTGGGEGN